MDFTILYGMLFWSIIVFLILGSLACIMYVCAKYADTKIQVKLFPFLVMLFTFSLVSGSLTFLGMYYSKKFGVEYEYKAILKIIITLVILSYFIKSYKTKK